MHQILNTLYVMTARSYLRLDHETVKVVLGQERKLQVPLHHLGALVCVGDVGASTALLHRCADDGRSVVFLDRSGRFKARLEGPTSGNVLLRRAQHLAHGDAARALAIARDVVAGKIQNARQVLLRGGREAADEADTTALQAAAQHLAGALPRLEAAADLDTVRGIEGDAAKHYYAAFDRMVKEDREGFTLAGRTRRPPLDRMNALLSFLYTLLCADCVAAVEGVGMDPQVGFLHALRPGRPALALDLMEELRSVLGDRLALTLVNRRQVGRSDFEERPGGAVWLTDKGRRGVVVAYQQRKQEEVQHPLAGQRVPLGLIPHVQARLLARHLRGELEGYGPFLYH
jgi:CRISPR-associated protein Cas1